MAGEMEFMHNLDWEKGQRVCKDLVKRGLQGKAFKEQDLSGAEIVDFAGLDYDLTEGFLRPGCSWKYLK